MSPTKQPFCATDWTCIMHQHQSTTQLNNQRTHKRHSLFQVALVKSSHAMASHVALVTSGAASAVRRTYHGGCVGRISLWSKITIKKTFKTHINWQRYVTVHTEWPHVYKHFGHWQIYCQVLIGNVSKKPWPFQPGNPGQLSNFCEPKIHTRCTRSLSIICLLRWLLWP